MTEEELSQLPGIRAIQLGPYSKEDGTEQEASYFKFETIQSTDKLRIGKAVLEYDYQSEALILKFEEESGGIE